MDEPVSIAAAALAGLSALLLMVVLAQLRSLGKAVEALTAAQAESASLIRKQEAAHQAVRGELKRIEDQIGGFDIVFSDIQARLSILKPNKVAAPGPAPGTAREPSNASARAVPASGTSDAPLSGPDRDAVAAPAPTPALQGQVEARASPDLDRGAGMSAAAAPSVADDSGPVRLEELLGEYRELIAEPRKNEINRWCDDVGGLACEVGEDGTLRPLSREAGGLLVLITQDDRVGVVVPGGRLVVDFATDFANVIAMRRVTRHAFELINDGTGLLRLGEAAVAQREGDKWQLVRPGTLAGLKSE